MRIPPDLDELFAEQLAIHIDRVPVGSALQIEPSDELWFVLELLIPRLLLTVYPEWQTESIDGFFPSRAVKTDPAGAELAGTCILISDQTVTPFALTASLCNAHRIEGLWVRLGEPGTGRLGISGPTCTSQAAKELLHGLHARLDDVHWAYNLSMEQRCD